MKCSFSSCRAVTVFFVSVFVSVNSDVDESEVVVSKNGSGDAAYSKQMEQVIYAGVPRDLGVRTQVHPHIPGVLQLNVTWTPPDGPIPLDYTLEVWPTANTKDCESQMCYEYNIDRFSRWAVAPSSPSSVAESACEVRAGCAYRVSLLAHPWDGRTRAELNYTVDECVGSVCSCTHAEHTPAPRVSLAAGRAGLNVSWWLPVAIAPRRLPRGLRAMSYVISVGLQRVYTAHHTPWFGHDVTTEVDGGGGEVWRGDDQVRWCILPAPDEDFGRKPVPGGPPESRSAKELRGNYMARVWLLDSRGCKGPPGNDTLLLNPDFVPVAGPGREWYRRPEVLAGIAAACAAAAALALAARARWAKRLLAACRPPAPLRAHPAWLPLQPGAVG